MTIHSFQMKLKVTHVALALIQLIAWGLNPAWAQSPQRDKGNAPQSKKVSAPVDFSKEQKLSSFSGEYTAQALLEIIRKNATPRQNISGIEEAMKPHLSSSNKVKIQMGETFQNALIESGDRKYKLEYIKGSPFAFKVNGKELAFEGTETPEQQFRVIQQFVLKQETSVAGILFSLLMPKADAFFESLNNTQVLLGIAAIYVGVNLIYGSQVSCPAYKKHASIISQQPVYCARVDNNVNGHSTASFQSQYSPFGWLGSELSCPQAKSYVNLASPCSLEQMNPQHCHTNFAGTRVCVQNGEVQSSGQGVQDSSNFFQSSGGGVQDQAEGRKPASSPRKTAPSTAR